MDEIVDGPQDAAVRVGDLWYRAAWVFDSRRGPPSAATVRLVQRFTGWTVESTQLRLDPSVATLFDFRTTQESGVGFVYMLPFSGERVLVEHVFIGPPDASPPAPEELLAKYLRTYLGLVESTVTRRRRRVDIDRR